MRKTILNKSNHRSKLKRLERVCKIILCVFMKAYWRRMKNPIFIIEFEPGSGWPEPKPTYLIYKTVQQKPPIKKIDIDQNKLQLFIIQHFKTIIQHKFPKFDIESIKYLNVYKVQTWTKFKLNNRKDRYQITSISKLNDTEALWNCLNSDIGRISISWLLYYTLLKYNIYNIKV